MPSPEPVFFGTHQRTEGSVLSSGFNGFPFRIRKMDGPAPTAGGRMLHPSREDFFRFFWRVQEIRLIGNFEEPFSTPDGDITLGVVEIPLTRAPAWSQTASTERLLCTEDTAYFGDVGDVEDGFFWGPIYDNDFDVIYQGSGMRNSPFLNNANPVGRPQIPFRNPAPGFGRGGVRIADNMLAMVDLVFPWTGQFTPPSLVPLYEWDIVYEYEDGQITHDYFMSVDVNYDGYPPESPGDISASQWLSPNYSEVAAEFLPEEPFPYLRMRGDVYFGRGDFVFPKWDISVTGYFPYAVHPRVLANFGSFKVGDPNPNAGEPIWNAATGEMLRDPLTGVLL